MPVGVRVPPSAPYSSPGRSNKGRKHLETLTKPGERSSGLVFLRPLTSSVSGGKSGGNEIWARLSQRELPLMLTDTAVRNAKPGPKAVKLFDGGGLYLEVAPAGGKWWRLKYRHGGKEKRISFGVYPDVSLKDARERRDEARKLIANGIDPSKTRQDGKAEAKAQAAEDTNTFEVVARDWHAKQVKVWSEGHAAKVLGRIEQHLFPAFGSIPISTLRAPAILPTLREIEAKGNHETARATALPNALSASSRKTFCGCAASKPSRNSAWRF